ncbi:MAG: glycosyltransferase [Candidatus Omnitrophica bacterium]|nr:glycosyltransferase [Candidatus Omnitrophota bacterium]
MVDSRKKKILIIYATAGAGHKKAAFAIHKALQTHASSCELTLVDSLDYTNSFFKWAYPHFYLFMVEKIPALWGFFYYMLDWKPLYPLVRPIRRINNYLNTSALVKLINSLRPDVVISTHFLATEVVSALKKGKRPDMRLITVITDYRNHSFWVSCETDLFTVAHEATRQDLMSWGVESSKIKVTGIPVSSVFAETADRKDIAARLGIAKDLFTALVVSGGYGVGPIEELTATLSGLNLKLQLLVVCGHNKALYERMVSRWGSDGMVRIYGFVDNMHELMSASDVIITKSGGLTTSEALAKGLPMVIIAPVPGQETRNCGVVVDSNTALMAGDVQQASEIIKDITINKGRLELLRRSAEEISKPRAAEEIARLALEEV